VRPSKPLQLFWGCKPKPSKFLISAEFNGLDKPLPLALWHCMVLRDRSDSDV
jgi:hypothetical protein